MSKRFIEQFTASVPKGGLILCSGALAIWIGGCTVGEDPTVTGSGPSPAASPATPAQAFTKPTVPEKDKKLEAGKAGSKVAGLLQSTDPSERARQVQRGINGKDPFSSIPPLVSFKVPIKLPESNGQSGSTPSVGTRVGNRPTPVANQPTVATRPSLPLPPVKPAEKSPIQALPPLPDPTLARAVQVTGVIVVAGVPQAIIQAPNEGTSRYVQAGQRISNGQVLVKRIEVNNGSDPIVILEENGIEVARAVGSPATAPNAPNTPPARTALVPTEKKYG